MRERQESGFTLVEAMIAMVLFGILVAIAAPPYAAYRTRQQHIGATRELVAFLRRAQVRAVAEETMYRVDITSNGTKATMYRYATSTSTSATAGQVLEMPSSKITMTNASFTQPSGGTGTSVWFYARGSGSKGSIKLSRSGSSKQYTVEVEGLTARVSYK